MKQKILTLRQEGKTYREIQKTLNCSLSLVAYYCNNTSKEKNRQQQIKWKENNTLAIKLDTFNNFKRRLKYQSDEFQRKKTGPGKIPRKDKTTSFKWQDVFRKIEENPFCYLTGDKLNLSDPKAFSFDHILPVSKGGSNDFENLGVCTMMANQSKHSMTVDEYIELCKKVLINFGYKVEKMS